MTILHRGFDTLHLSIKASLPFEFLAFLDAELNRAKVENAPILTEYADIAFHLKPHGSSGYQFLLDQGPDGASWAFKRPHAKDPWGVRILVGSRFLALYGLRAAKTHIEDVLSAWGLRYQPQDVSIARVDFCVDIFAPNFTLMPDNFVMHSGTGRRDYITSTDKAVNGKSGRATSVTLGKMPNRQVIFYDKRAEVIQRGKSHWWGIWNYTLRRLGLPYIRYVGGNADEESGPDSLTLPYIREPYVDGSDPNTSRVWRVEFRAGKDCLKDTWGIRKWEDLFASFGDLVRHMGEVIRYTDPDPSDTNRARWPNNLLWEIVVAEMNQDLTEMRSGAEPNPLKMVHREQHIGLIFRQALGLQLTLAALRGVNADGLQGAFEGAASEMVAETAKDPEWAAKQLQSAKNKYVFFGEGEGQI